MSKSLEKKLKQIMEDLRAQMPVEPNQVTPEQAQLLFESKIKTRH